MVENEQSVFTICLEIKAKYRRILDPKLMFCSVRGEKNARCVFDGADYPPHHLRPQHSTRACNMILSCNFSCSTTATASADGAAEAGDLTAAAADGADVDDDEDDEVDEGEEEVSSDMSALADAPELSAPT